MTHPPHHRDEQGNILFLILLAVVLFAALSYAVTSSTRGGGKDASAETYIAYTSEMLNYVTLLEQTVTRLQLSNGCTDRQISFETPGSSDYTNSLTPADGRCKLFDPAGGGMALQTVNDKLLISDAEALATSWGASFGTGSRGKHVFPNQVYVPNIGGTSDCTNGACRSLVVGFAWVKKEACDAINAKLGITSGTGGYPIGGLTDFFKGTFTAAGQVANTNSNRTACVYNTTAYGNAFIHVLKLR